jgi:3-oxoacyl-[acyl-carrier protein] reductase
MADLDGTTGIAGGSHHCAAKAGVIGFIKSVAREVAMQGIPVSAIVPRYIDTPLLDLAGEGRATQVAFIAGRTLLGRPGEAREIAATALFLASPGASNFTEQVLSPNGGMVV